jgi:hypothetical protein
MENKENKVEKTEAEISQEFKEEYRKLCMKYKRDWFIDPVIPRIAVLNMIEEIPAEKLKEIKGETK